MDRDAWQCIDCNGIVSALDLIRYGRAGIFEGLTDSEALFFAEHGLVPGG
jgi:hypothetical protein